MKFKLNVRPYMPSLRDLHLYGGALLVAVGAWLYDPRLALGVVGVYLVYLGRPWR